MANMDIGAAVVGDFNTDAYADQTSNTDFYDGTNTPTDGETGNETYYTCDFDKWHGYYEDVPIFAAAIDALACWAVGKGFKGKDADKLKNIKGFGKDDINSIFENLLRVCLLGGDSQAEQIKDKAGRLINLKSFNPSTIKHVANKYGMLIRYEQNMGNKVIEKWEPKKIFHLSWDRLADEIHGKSYAKRVEPIIKQIKQLQEDLGLRFHRVVKPVRLFEASTDNPTDLASTEAKLKEGYTKCELIVIPKGTLAPVPHEITPSADDAISYMNTLLRSFVSSIGVPEIILGWSTGTTEASAKIIYLAFQQRIERIQKFLEEQIRLQLGLEVEFEFPASLEQNMTESPKANSPNQDMAKRGKQITKE